MFVQVGDSSPFIRRDDSRVAKIIGTKPQTIVHMKGHLSIQG